MIKPFDWDRSIRRDWVAICRLPNRVCRMPCPRSVTFYSPAGFGGVLALPCPKTHLVLTNLDPLIVGISNDAKQTGA